RGGARLRGAFGPSGRRRRRQSDAVRGDGGVAARVRRAASAGHSALAHGIYGRVAVVLDWYHWDSAGRAGGVRPEMGGQPLDGRRDQFAVVAATDRGRRDAGDGLGVGVVRSPLAAADRTGNVAALTAWRTDRDD